MDKQELVKEKKTSKKKASKEACSTPKNKGGRPSMLTKELAEFICGKVSTMPKSLKSICEMFPGMPHESMIYEWRVKHPWFADMYAKAKQAQVNLLAEEIIEISDDSRHDTIIDEDGNERINSEFVARSRLRIDSRKWLAAKLAPKIYGDRPQSDVTEIAQTLIEKLLEKK